MRPLFFLLSLILILSLSFHAGFPEYSGLSCLNCDSDDCSDDPAGDCYAITYGCTQITDEARYVCGYVSAWLTCNSDALERVSDFTLNGIPYYCTNYNQTQNYVWKTCYSGVPDPNRVSNKTACVNGVLITCSQTEVCQYIFSKYYCVNSSFYQAPTWITTWGWFEETSGIYQGSVAKSNPSGSIWGCCSSTQCCRNKLGFLYL